MYLPQCTSAFASSNACKLHEPYTLHLICTVHVRICACTMYVHVRMYVFYLIFCSPYKYVYIQWNFLIKDTTGDQEKCPH